MAQMSSWKGRHFSFNSGFHVLIGVEPFSIHVCMGKFGMLDVICSATY